MNHVVFVTISSLVVPQITCVNVNGLMIKTCLNKRMEASSLNLLHAASRNCHLGYAVLVMKFYHLKSSLNKRN